MLNIRPPLTERHSAAFPNTTRQRVRAEDGHLLPDRVRHEQRTHFVSTVPLPWIKVALMLPALSSATSSVSLLETPSARIMSPPADQAEPSIVRSTSSLVRQSHRVKPEGFSAPRFVLNVLRSVVRSYMCLVERVCSSQSNFAVVSSVKETKLSEYRAMGPIRVTRHSKCKQISTARVLVSRLTETRGPHEENNAFQSITKDLLVSHRTSS